jgi:hypothetical protein
VRLIQAILSQDVFSALLVLTGIFLLIKQRHLHASMCLIFFIVGYHVTQIPLVSGWAITIPEKYVAQGIISLCLIALYGTFSDITAPVLVACINELILIGVNIIFLVYPFHSWFHWLIFGVVNWISFVLLVLNWRNYNKRYVSSGVFREFNIVKARGNLHTRRSHHLQKNKAVASEGKC